MTTHRISLATLAACLAATPVMAANIQINAQNPVIELTITEVVQSIPDTAQVGAGVTVRAATASEALRRNAEQMDKVIAKLRQAGIAREDIQTSNFSLNAQYQYRNDGLPPTFLGYDAGNMITVTLRKMDKVAETLDAMVLAGANNVNGPNFTLEKDRPAKAVARKAAFEHGQAQAMEYARTAGYSGIRLLEVSESISQTGPMQFGPQAIAVTSGGGESAKTQIEPGRVGTGVTLVVKYEMTR